MLRRTKNTLNYCSSKIRTVLSPARPLAIFKLFNFAAGLVNVRRLAPAAMLIYLPVGSRC
jgi:hypothetical protein